MSTSDNSSRALDRTIAHSWPHPLAAGWRRVVAHSEPAARFEALLSYNETLLRTLVCWQLPDYLRGEPKGGKRHHIEALLDKLGRASDGDWQKLLVRMARHIGARGGPAPFVEELAGWLEQRGGDGKTREEQLNHLIYLRNNAVHGVAPVGGRDRQTRDEAFERLLREILASLGWLAGYRMVRVLRAEPAADGRFHGTLAVHVGSDAAPEAVEAHWRGWLATDTLYLLDPQARHALTLHPLVQWLSTEERPEERLFLFKKRTAGKRGATRDFVGLVHEATGEFVERAVHLGERDDATFGEWLEQRSAHTWCVELEEVSANLRAEQPARELSGELLADRYEVLDVLGEGGMARVLRVRDHRLGREVALKVLDANLDGDPVLRERFEREARVMRRVEHPHVLRLYDLDSFDDGRPFLTMPLAEGGSLAERLDAGSVVREDAVRWAREAARGLGALHAAGVVHRDIKPSNLLLDADGHVLVADLGIARDRNDATLTHGHEQIGSLAYMSPEQRAGQRASEASDVYSLGVVLHELLTGRRPLDGPGEDLGDDLGRVLRRMGAKQPHDRPRTEDLDAILGDERPLEPSLETPAIHTRVPAEAATQPETPAREAEAGERDAAPVLEKDVEVERLLEPQRRAVVSPLAVAVGGVLVVVCAALLYWVVGLRSSDAVSRAGATDPNKAVNPMETVRERGMVFIEGGAFTVGLNDGELARDMALCTQSLSSRRCAEKEFKDERPPTGVTIESFYLDRSEVSRAQYEDCVEAGACVAIDELQCGIYRYHQEPGKRWQIGRALPSASRRPDAPQGCVVREEAQAYCAWIGGRLPRDEEWERAARGTEGRIFPWGNEPPTSERAVFKWGSSSDEHPFASVLSLPQGATPEGVHHMAGNLYEWVDGDPCRFGTACEPRKGILRGGGYMSDPAQLRTTARKAWPADAREDHQGFRCAIEAP